MHNESHNTIPLPEHPASVTVARALFPRGLSQPEGSFRFSSDALLLAAFPSLAGQERVLDLGAGCGVVGLALLCRAPGLTVTGVDCQAALVAAAARNAARLGFASRYTALCTDLGAAQDTDDAFGGETPQAPGPQAFDLVTANPPYRQRHRGRLPRNRARLTALFETGTTQDDFCRAAALALRCGGRFAVIYPAAREAELTRTLARHNLTPCRVLPLAPKRSRAPELLLMESVKAPAAVCVRENPLTLHDEDGAFSDEALAFCPLLEKKNS